ncbi:MAG TPA: 50S ribosomal protein L33 [Candidatus Paceibacterota bacterium]|nr:50S ribosomal protein L33 [Candidatus Paceibacterota bacterium]
MAAKKKPYAKFQCADCKYINYFVRKSKKATESKLALKKFCSHCKKRTMHKETKK